MNREEIEQTLAKLNVEMDASECQGVLVGLLIANDTVSAAEVQQALAPSLDTGNLLAQEAMKQMLQFLGSTQAQLADSSCAFNPMLADDSDNMDDKLDMLSAWIQGFLMGLAHGGVKDYSKLPDEAAEFAEDMVDMAQVNSYELEDDEEANEEAYMELVEYLRTGILLMNELMHPTQAAPLPEQPTLH
ncbi:MAG: UPF0149 family protein [Gammaproteobacteria bacterium]|nr:UPF0149 family protein [Gammaproteobacteria bacterium]